MAVLRRFLFKEAAMLVILAIAAVLVFLGIGAVVMLRKFRHNRLLYEDDGLLRLRLMR